MIRLFGYARTGNNSRTAFTMLAAWGVWWLFIGGVQVSTGLFLLSRRPLSVVFAISIVVLNAFTQLMWLGVYPAWAIAAIVLDGLILWALTTHIDEFE